MLFSLRYYYSAIIFFLNLLFGLYLQILKWNSCKQPYYNIWDVISFFKNSSICFINSISWEYFDAKAGLRYGTSAPIFLQIFRYFLLSVETTILFINFDFFAAFIVSLLTVSYLKFWYFYLLVMSPIEHLLLQVSFFWSLLTHLNNDLILSL